MRTKFIVLFLLFLIRYISSVPIYVARVGNVDSFSFLKDSELYLPYEWKFELLETYESIKEIPDAKMASYHLICMEKGISNFYEKERIRRYLDQGGIVISPAVSKDHFKFDHESCEPIKWDFKSVGNADIFPVGQGAWIKVSNFTILNKDEIQTLINYLDKGAQLKIGVPDSLSLEATLENFFQGGFAFNEDKIIGICNGMLGAYSYHRNSERGKVDLEFNNLRLISEGPNLGKNIKFIQICPYTKNIIVGQSNLNTSFLYLIPIDSLIQSNQYREEIQLPEGGQIVLDKVFFCEGKMLVGIKEENNSPITFYVYDLENREWAYKELQDQKKEYIKYKFSISDKPGSSNFIKLQYVKDPFGSQSSQLGVFTSSVDNDRWQVSQSCISAKSEGPIFIQNNIDTRSDPYKVNIKTGLNQRDQAVRVMGDNGAKGVAPKIWFENKNKILELLQDKNSSGNNILSFPFTTDDLAEWKKNHISFILDYWCIEGSQEEIGQDFQLNNKSITSMVITTDGTIFIVVSNKYVFAIDVNLELESNDLKILYQYDLGKNILISQPIEYNGNVSIFVKDENEIKEILFPCDLKNIELSLGKAPISNKKNIKLIQEDKEDQKEFSVRGEAFDPQKNSVKLQFLSYKGKKPFINKVFRLKGDDSKTFQIDSNLIKEKLRFKVNGLIGNVTRIGEDVYFFYNVGNNLYFSVNDPKNIIDKNLEKGWENAQIIRKEKSLILCFNEKLKIYSKQKWIGVTEEKAVVFYKSFETVEQEELFKGLGTVSQAFQDDINPSIVWALDKTTGSLNTTEKNMNKFEVNLKIPHWLSHSSKILNDPLDFQLYRQANQTKFLVLEPKLKRILDLQLIGDKLELIKVSPPSFLSMYEGELIGIDRIIYNDKELWILGLNGVQNQVILYDPLKGRTLFIKKGKIKDTEKIAEIDFEEIRKVTCYLVTINKKKELRLMITDRSNIYELTSNSVDFESLFQEKNWTPSWHWDSADYQDKDLFFATRYFSGEIGITGRWQIQDGQNNISDEEGFLLLSKAGDKIDYFPMKELKSVYPYAY